MDALKSAMIGTGGQDRALLVLRNLEDQLRAIDLDRQGWEGLANQYKHQRDSLEEQLEALDDAIRDALDFLNEKSPPAQILNAALRASNPASEPDA